MFSSRDGSSRLWCGCSAISLGSDMLSQRLWPVLSVSAGGRVMLRLARS